MSNPNLTLQSIPEDLENVDYLSWALDVLAGDACPSRRISDFIMRYLIKLGDFECMDKLLAQEQKSVAEYEAKYGRHYKRELPTDGFEYVVDVLHSECDFYSLDVALKHFIATANHAGLEAVLNACALEFLDWEEEVETNQEYARRTKSVDCPFCGAAAGADCKTKSGNPIPLHSARARAAMSMEATA